jgi:hypothetical protein
MSMRRHRVLDSPIKFANWVKDNTSTLRPVAAPPLSASKEVPIVIGKDVVVALRGDGLSSSSSRWRKRLERAAAEAAGLVVAVVNGRGSSVRRDSRAALSSFRSMVELGVAEYAKMDIRVTSRTTRTMRQRDKVRALICAKRTSIYFYHRINKLN